MTISQNQQLSFLQEKIQEIGSAIFFNLSDSVVKLPTSIVNTLHVDDYGYVWFFVQKARKTLKEVETEFPVRMDFFKKGVDSFLQITGKGWVVNDPEEINAYVTIAEDLNSITDGGMVLVKVKIMKAEYNEAKAPEKESFWKSMVSSVTALFGSDPYRPGNIYFPA